MVVSDLVTLQCLLVREEAVIQDHRGLLATQEMLGALDLLEQRQPFFVSHLPGAMEARVGTPERPVMEARVGLAGPVLMVRPGLAGLEVAGLAGQDLHVAPSIPVRVQEEVVEVVQG